MKSVHLIYLVGYLMTVLTSGQAWADADLIHITRDGCNVVSVRDHEPRPGCPDDAACRNKGDRVKWLVTPYARFSVAFGATSPFDDDGCLSGEGTCTVSNNAASGPYDYAVTLDVEGCGPIDPRIIVN